ncbi:MAG: DUF6702 family protein [Bacteroidales bacterium]
MSLMMHPVHVSFTNLEYLPDEEKMNVSFKVFTKDFRLLFVHLYEENIRFGEKGNYSQFQDKIDQYFNHHFKIKSENQNFELKNVGIETVDEYTWFYFDIPLNGNLSGELLVKNTVLLDLFLDQKNLLIFKSGDFEDGYQFDIRKKELLIPLK